MTAAARETIVAARETVAAALQSGNIAAIEAVGWGEMLSALRWSWAPKQTCTPQEAIPYARLLGDEDPAAILEALEALEALAGEWRPTPGAIRGYLNAQRADDGTVHAGATHDPSSSERAIEAVGAAHRAGERPCECFPHPANWVADASSVLRCPACAGLEQGQVDQALDPPREDADESAAMIALDVAEVVRLRRISG